MDPARYRAAERRLWDSVGVAPSERLVDLGTTACTVRVQEVGEGRPVVLVHGASAAGASWASLVARLPGVRCVLVDRPGCGLSPPLAIGLRDVARLESFADAFVVDLVDALELPAAGVVATSFGGYFALRGAAAHPERIERVAVLGWTVGVPFAHVPIAMRLGAAPGLGWLTARVPPTRRAVRSLLRGIGLRAAVDSGRFTDVMLDWYLALLRDTPTMRNEIATAPRLVRPLRGFDERLLLPPRLLAGVRVPVAFVGGDDDPFGGAPTARSFSAQVPGAELRLVPGAGHAPWIDEPDEVAEDVHRFLVS